MKLPSVFRHKKAIKLERTCKYCGLVIKDPDNKSYCNKDCRLSDNAYDIYRKTKFALVHEYRCFKCGVNFKLDHELDTDKPTCDKCFKELLQIDNVDDYYKFLGE